MSKISPKIELLLNDIRKSSERIVSRLTNETYDNFVTPEFSDAKDVVARHLAIIGEAAGVLKNKFPDFCTKNLEILNVHTLYSMRNVLIHNYGGINWDIVWHTAKDDIPELILNILTLLDENTRPLVDAALFCVEHSLDPRESAGEIERLWGERAPEIRETLRRAASNPEAYGIPEEAFEVWGKHFDVGRTRTSPGPDGAIVTTVYDDF
jgi:uncharacterized protein with HEPN domain